MCNDYMINLAPSPECWESSPQAPDIKGTSLAAPKQEGERYRVIFGFCESWRAIFEIKACQPPNSQPPTEPAPLPPAA